MPATIEGQQVIVYDSPKGRALPYDTAYDEDQVSRALRNCVLRYEAKANVRAMSAAERFPG